MVPFTARQLTALFAATLIPRALLAVMLGVVGEPERWEYDVIAASIADGSGHTYERMGFVYSAYAPPLWSYLLAALLHLPGVGRGSIQLVQGLLCFGSAAIYGGLARRIAGDDRVGMLAGLLVALQPSLLYYSVAKSDPLPLNVLLVGLIAWAGLELLANPTSTRAAWFGFLVGASVLSRGTPIVALPVFAIAVLLRWEREALRPVVIATLALILCNAPWLARNFVLLGTPLITSTAGENFWRGNHEGAGGGVLDRNGGAITLLEPTNPALPASIRRVLFIGTETERDEAFMDEARKFVRTHPREAIGLFVTKLRTFWWRIDPHPQNYSPSATLAYEIVYRIELALAAVGVFLVFRKKTAEKSTPDRWAAGLTLALMVGISLLQSAFYVQGRHRFLIEPLLLTLTSCGLVAVFSRVSSAAGTDRNVSAAGVDVDLYS